MDFKPSCLYCPKPDPDERLFSLSNDTLAALYCATLKVNNPNLHNFRALVKKALGSDFLYGPDRPKWESDRHGVYQSASANNYLGRAYFD